VADVPPVLRVLIETAGGLVRQSSSGRVALARAADVVVPEALPAELREVLPRALERARAETTEPLRPAEVERVLATAWGSGPGRVVDEWDPEPVAVTPAAQVHRAELDGRAVAVKVRRPGLEAAVRNDLALVDAISAPLGQVLAAADVRALLREAREMALDELDLEHEAQQQRQAARLLRRVEDVEVPKVHLEHTTEDVLVTDFLEGPVLGAATPDDPSRVARALVRAHVTAARGGLALTDPRPGHVILRPDGGIGLLGTGLARPVDRDRVRAALAAAAALRADDGDAWADALADDLSLLPRDRAEEALALTREVLGPFAAGPARLDPAAAGAGADRAVARLGPALRLAAAARPAPTELGAGRGTGQLVAVLLRLQAEEDWLALAAEDAGG
jgi:predicted unusual protein kinase regulating ubiquinone biosynthesis (AarF/ABC1/UbiB family)